MQSVAGEENVADILTKNVKSEVLEKHMAEMGFAKEIGERLARDWRRVDGCT